MARKLGIATVPYLGRWTLDQIVTAVKSGIPSITAGLESGEVVMSEGVVARPIETLFDKRGHRVILKLKTKDFGKPCAERTQSTITGRDVSVTAPIT